MPSRNITRFDDNDSYYHVYARGASKESIYRDDTDKAYFSYLLSRHLGKEPVVNKQGYAYPYYRGKVEVVAYCFMGNHFHLLVYQYERGALQRLMKSVMTAYSMYFNRKYKRTGSLFENRYKASQITSDTYLMHISRYIHLNPRSWRRYEWSSYQHIFDTTGPEWLEPTRVAELFASRQSYHDFMTSYEDMKESLDIIKHELANM